MVATQHGSNTKQGTSIIGHRQQHKGQEGRYNNIAYSQLNLQQNNVSFGLGQWAY
jgi:hypothetical protein